MRSKQLGVLCVGLLGLGAYLSGASQGDAVVRIRLVDAAGKDLGGIVRLWRGQDAKPEKVQGLFNRLLGLSLPEEAKGWCVVPVGGAVATLPREKIRLEALSGLESERIKPEFDLTGKTPEEIVLRLPMLFRPEQHGLIAGNTHLHLMKISKQQSDDYLRLVPAADGLRIMFISYLERFKDDAEYITNTYPVGALAFKGSGVLFNNGEEYRHNFKAHGQGYGHVMFLDMRKHILPASLGPGITGAGFDDEALAAGIDAARKQGATIIWCHNTFGHEDVVSAVAGRLHALNVFDGSRLGAYEDNYYRYLDIGMRLPISTGTDWFLYDFARVYAGVKGSPTIRSWLEALMAGRNVISNGPLLTLTVDGQEPGIIIALEKPKKLTIKASALGRHDFQRLQLIHNGKVIRSLKSAGQGPFKAKLTAEVRIDEPSWIAARIDGQTKNELDRPLYAHSSPVYVDVAGRRRFDVDAARGLLKLIEEGQEAIRVQGRFSSERARQQVNALYEDAARNLRERINAAGR